MFTSERVLTGLLEAEQALYEIRMRRADNTFLGHVALAFLGFLGEDVTFEGLLVSDLAGAGYFKTLFGTRVRFDLWHFEMLFLCFPDGGPAQAGHLWSRLGRGAKVHKKNRTACGFLVIFRS